MYNYEGKCRCGEVNFTLILPEKIEKYSPRECDCDFCVNNQLSYLSDSNACLKISSKAKFSVLKQGSKQASFLKCAACGAIIGAFAEFKDGLKGALNANLLDDFEQLQKPGSISPKVLSPEEKLDRWDTLWMVVSIDR